ncbi:isochorismatase family cysteine hydrolase [Actinoplanes sp. NPDC051861]|uniref:cysteine hydrolase family protein n=1 Tax=Actinoplanes sp. NPDC051861 TaxID=3155170 RepID=UPI00342C44D6
MSAADYTEPHWAASALVVIDMQVDFTGGGALPVPGTDEVVPGVARLAEGFRAARRPIVHIVRLYQPGSADVDPPRRAFVEAGGQAVAPGTPGSAVIAGLATDAGEPLELDAGLLLSGVPQEIGKDEIVLFKPRWSAFFRTGLEDWLRERGVDTVVVAGCNLPNCPRATLFDASERDFRAVLAEDAVSQATPERLADMAAIGVRLLPASAILAAL